MNDRIIRVGGRVHDLRCAHNADDHEGPCVPASPPATGKDELTAEHDADVAYYQREVYHVGRSVGPTHPEYAELNAEVKRLGQVRQMIQSLTGLSRCPDADCVLLEGHVCGHAHYEAVVRIRPVPASTSDEQKRISCGFCDGWADGHVHVEDCVMGAPVASGTPKPMNVVLGVLREMANGSPAPAAPGVELDFEKADADSREEGSTWTSGYAQRYRKALNAQVRALVDAAVLAERKRCDEENSAANRIPDALRERKYAPLLALVAEWQRTREAWKEARRTHEEEPVMEWKAFLKAEAALAAWRKP